MSSSSDKPKRPLIRIKREAADVTAASEPRKRPPVRGRHKPADKTRKPVPPPAPATPAARPEKPAAAQGAEREPRRRPRPDTGTETRSEAPRPSRPRPPSPPQPPREHGTQRGEKPAAGQRRGKPEPGTGERARARQERLFAACPRGLEAELGKELAELGATDVQPASGGVTFKADLPTAWRVNLWSRLAIRVLWQVGQGTYRGEEDLYRAALALPWTQWFPSDRSIAVHTVAHACPLKSLNFVTLRIKDAVCDRFRAEDLARPDVQTRDPDVPLLVYLERDRYTLYIDLSGAPLNRRGFRVQAAQAPLNENLAAGLLRLAGWTPDQPLLDPMMGGGTILLEAALMALNIAPGLKRHFAFENLNNFQPEAWQRIRREAEATARPKRELPLYGADIDPRMVRAAKANFNAAGLGGCAALIEGDVLEIEAPEEHGFIVSNPPYGVRLENEDMGGFYKGLGDVLKKQFTGWSAWLLSADPELPKGIGLRATRRTPLFNGPLECRLLEYRMIAGSLRRPPRAED